MKTGSVGEKGQEQRWIWLVGVGLGLGLGIRGARQRLQLLHGTQKGALVQKRKINGEVFLVNVKLGEVSKG
jgi:hypothetical protein